jgi:hypothetical protein
MSKVIGCDGKCTEPVILAFAQPKILNCKFIHNKM